MEIICTERRETAYWPMFGGTPVDMTVATVEFHIPGEGVTVMTFSHRADDPEDMFLADSRIGPNGFPVFVHGEGDRTCSKQIAGPEIVSAIWAWEG